MKRPSYRAAIEWVAWNDEATETDESEVMPLISTALIADLFGVEQVKVAADIVRVRERVLGKAGGV